MPFLVEVAVATPEVKVIAVALPKLIAVPELSAIVGRAPLGLAEAPEKVRFLAPV